MLGDVLGDLFQSAIGRVAGGVVQQLKGRAGDVRCYVWGRMLQESQTLLQSRAVIEIPQSCSYLAQQLQLALDICVTKLPQLLTACRTNGQGEADELECVLPLKLGCGNPGQLGCADIAGKCVRWEPLVNKRHGVEAAFEGLRLAGVGLPGARLHRGAVPPPAFRYELSSRGGPSYASCSVATSPELAIRVREDIGSNRRLWTDVLLADNTFLHWLTYQFPPEGIANDVEWRNELEGLESDLVSLAAEGGVIVNFIAAGDLNMQPEELGGREHSRVRLCLWNSFVGRYNLLVHNPVVGEGELHKVFLPSRNRTVLIMPGSTHHGPGTARAIDVVFGSADIEVEVIIHNSLSCEGSTSGCCWQNCQDYARGDHFFLELRLAVQVRGGALRATPAFPQSWLRQDKWEFALRQGRPVLKQLACLADAVATQCRQEKMNRPLVEWLVDAVVVLSSVTCGLLRDAWVQTAGVGVTTLRQRVSLQVLPADPDELARQLKQVLETHGVGQSLLTKCYRWLKPRLPAAAARMMEGSSLLSTQLTHSGWVSSLLEQCSWPTLWNREYDRDVQIAVDRVVWRLERQIGAGPLDQSFYEPEVLAIVPALDSSKAMPPDLLPRVIYTCQDEVMSCFTWKMLELTGPACAAYRPRLWRWAVLFTLRKKGDPLFFASFRKIFVKCQLGLLQETLLTRRLLPSVLPAISEGQSGYCRGVEDAQLLLLELSAWARRFGIPLWSVYGDFVKAFPRTWR
ncbi:unnamed protein product [Polarella glacialis]|uniref:Reverse transcriptase domain-containing protein n=1 Tax=Polarella glacialis TaxID=89957 RepID=A0A813K022_POLGL|nr:unnamed protein product [Polarella glacialis]